MENLTVGPGAHGSKSFLVEGSLLLRVGFQMDTSS